MAGAHGMIAGLKTAEDRERLFAVLIRAPMDGISLEQLPVPVWKILYKRWAALDPAAALRATTTVPQRQLSMSLVSTVFSEWLLRDRAAVMTALDDLPDGWPRSMGQHVVFSELSTTDPAAALIWRNHCRPAMRGSLPCAPRSAHGPARIRRPRWRGFWRSWTRPLAGSSCTACCKGGVMSRTHPDMVWQTLQEHVSDSSQRRDLRKQFA